MRILLSFAAIVGLAATASAQSHSHEANTNRHGGTFETLSAASAQSCAEICRADKDCLAWSFLEPNTAAGPPQCELKQTIGRAEHNPLMTSGISPRLSSQQNAAPRRNADSLLGGESTRRPTTIVPARRAQPAQTSLREDAFSSRVVRQAPAPARASQSPSTPPPPSSGRVLTPNDPRIVRTDGASTATSVPRPPSPASPRVPASTRVLAPPPRLPANTGAAPIRQATPSAAEGQRPYDNLRDREFPRYSVQDGEELAADAAGNATSGAGS